VTADWQGCAQARAFEEDLVLFDTETGEGEFHPQPPEEIEYAYRAWRSVRAITFPNAIQKYVG